MGSAAQGASGALSGAAAGATVGSVVPGIGTAIGAVGGAIIGGAIGLFGGTDNSDQIAQLQAEQQALYQKFGPVDLSNPIVFNQFKNAGLLSPQMEQAVQLQQDQKLTMTVNPQDRANEEQSLGQIQQLSQTGLGPQDLAAFRQLQSQTGQDTQAKTQQILQGSQMRGQGGSGDTLAAMLMANQSSGENASSQATAIAGQAAAARRQALNSLFSGQAQVQGQDQSVAQVNNQNEMLRRQFLDQNTLARQQYNTTAQNQANLYNTTTNQNLQNQNTSVANQELLREENAKQQYFEDQMQQANAEAGNYQSQINSLTGQQSNSNQNMSNIFSGMGQLASAYAGGVNASSTPMTDSSFTSPTLGSSASSSGTSAPITSDTSSNPFGESFNY